MTDKLDKLINLMSFLKDHYKREAFKDQKFGSALVKHHMEDFGLILDDEDVDRISFLLSPLPPRIN